MSAPRIDAGEGGLYPLRASSELRPVPGRRAIAVSLTAHLAVAAIAWAPAWRARSAGDTAAPPGRLAAVLLAPAPTRESPSPPPPAKRRGGESARPFPSSRPGPVPPLPGVRISVLPDHTHQLLPVLRRFDGRIALARMESPRTLLESFRARDLQPLGPARLDDWLAFRLHDPEAWPELAPILDRCPEDCIFYALLDLRFQFPILRAVAALPDRHRAVVQITLRFSAASPSGVEIVSVEGQPGAAARKVPERSDVSGNEDVLQ